MSRHELRKTFGEDAELYDRVRPSYPTGLYDDLAALLGNPARPRVLEIGCGTGQATTPMIRRGWSVEAVDLCPELAAVARNKLPELEVITAAFEDWPLPAEKFDLVLSATAFHWIDPEVRVVKSADALRPGGVLAVVSTHHVVGGSQPLFEDVQDCYLRFMPGTPEGLHLEPADAVQDDPGEFDAFVVLGSSRLDSRGSRQSVRLHRGSDRGRWGRDHQALSHPTERSSGPLLRPCVEPVHWTRS